MSFQKKYPNSRIEHQHNNFILCGVILPCDEIKVGQKWQSSEGHIVTVCNLNKHKLENELEYYWVDYEWQEKSGPKKISKNSFAFQCDYCLIID